MPQFLLFCVLISLNSQTWALPSNGPSQSGNARESQALKQKGDCGRLLHNAGIQSTINGETQHPGSALWQKSRGLSRPSKIWSFSIWQNVPSLFIFPMCFSSLSAFAALLTDTSSVWKEDGWVNPCWLERGQTAPGPSPGSGQVMPNSRGCLSPGVYCTPSLRMAHQFRAG